MRAPRPVGRIAGVAATTALLLLAVPPERARPDRVAVVALLAVCLHRLRRGLGGGARPRATWAPPVDEPGPPDEPASRLARLEAALRHAAESGDRYERSVRPLLARLAADRLRQVRGIDATTDPERAREAMGEQLWQTLSEPAGRGPEGPGRPPAEIDRLLARIEAL